MCDNCDSTYSLPIRCSRCGGLFCPGCIQVENHKCIPLKRSWGEYGRWQKKLKTVRSKKSKNFGKVNSDGVIFLMGNRVVSRNVYILERIEEEEV